jgi:hypothetical protein
MKTEEKKSPYTMAHAVKQETKMSHGTSNKANTPGL